MTCTRMVTASTRRTSGIQTLRRGMPSGTTQLSALTALTESSTPPRLTALRLPCSRPIAIQRPRLRGLGVYYEPQLHVHGAVRAAGVALLLASCPRFGAPLERCIATSERILF